MKKCVEGEWIVESDQSFESLVIADGGSLKAPPGKFLTLTVDGVGLDPLPGSYSGEVRVTVCDEFVRRTMRFGEPTDASYRSGVCVDDGRIVRGSSVAAIVRGGSVTDSEAAGISIESRQWDFNGFYITGDSEYTVNNADISLYGDGTDDFVGLGAGIAAAGSARVVVNNSRIRTEGITRGTVYVGGKATMTLNDCELSTRSYVPTPQQLEEGAKLSRMMCPPWMMGIRGNGRATNIAGHGSFYLNRCHVVSNSWGVLSVDGATVNRMFVKDSLIELIGDSGYGLFSICDDLAFDYKAFGDYGCIDVVDNSVVNVPSFGIIMSLGNASGIFKNGSVVNSGRFGAHIFRNSGGLLRVESGAVFNTGEACVLVSGANAFIELDGAVMQPKNGVIVQVMDNDDVGMGGPDRYIIPVGEADVYSGRCLTEAAPGEDVFVSVSNMEAAGDFLNASTDLKANCRPDPQAAPSGMPPMDFGDLRGMGEDLQGAKNLDIRLSNASVRGRVSSAVAAYKAGLTEIREENCEELSRVSLTPAPAVNNGVILSMDSGSRWLVTGPSHLTRLSLEAGAVITGTDGKAAVMTIDGRPAAILPGEYSGHIEIKPE